MVHSAKNILESQGLCITRKSEAATMGSLGTRHGAKAKRTVEAFQSAFYNRDGRKARCAKGVLKGTCSRCRPSILDYRLGFHIRS